MIVNIAQHLQLLYLPATMAMVCFFRLESTLYLHWQTANVAHSFLLLHVSKRDTAVNVVGTMRYVRLSNLYI